MEKSLRYYEDLEVGQVVTGTDSHRVTEEEIIEMGRRWDPQPFHTDPEAAAASHFGGLVASTVHLFGITVKMGMNDAPIAAVSSLGMTNVVNHAPARPGDRLRHQSTVIDRRLSKSRPDEGIVTIRGTLINDRDELVFSFENSALVRCRPADR